MTVLPFDSNELLDNPVHTSLFLMDFFLLAFVKFPPTASILLLGGLVYLSVYFGKRMTGKS